MVLVQGNTLRSILRANRDQDGLGFSAPKMLAILWSDASDASDIAEASSSNESFRTNMKFAIYTYSIAAILGSIAIIASIDWINRKHMLTFTFLVLAMVLAAAAGSFTELAGKGAHYVLVVFWIFISFLFSFGPNTLTFIVSPSCYLLQIPYIMPTAPAQKVPY